MRTFSGWRRSARAGWSRLRRGPGGAARARRRRPRGRPRARSSAMLGRSGSGKSTLLHLLGGLDRAEAGVIELGGEPVTGASERALSALRRRRVGFVFQFFHLLPELSGEANVLLAARVRGAHPDAARRAPRARRPARVAGGRRLAPAPALRRRAAALRDRAGARQRPGRPARRRADRQPRRRGRRRGAASCCAPAPTRAARSCSSPTSAAAAAIADRVLRLDAGRLVAA